MTTNAPTTKAMTTNAGRAAILVRALRASIEGDSGAVADLYTDDVKAWAPALSASSAADLAAEFDRRDDTFSGVQLEVVPLDVGGDFACVEWTVTMTHSGPLTLRDGVVLQPTGLSVTLNGATVAEFAGERICSFRQYWDEFAVLEQLGLLSDA
jgi:ketosteroid isomerase-like protein